MSDAHEPVAEAAKAPAKPDKASSPEPAPTVAGQVKSAAEALTELAKLALVIAVLVFLWSNREPVQNYALQWLDSASKLSFAGFSIERQNSAEKTIDEIKVKKGSLVDVDLARGAIARASRNAPAIQGSRILWVDDHPTNNVLEREVLKTIGIDVFLADDTKEALVLLRRVAPDLIISNIARETDKAQPLRNCPAHYFEMPDGVAEDIATLNKNLLEGNTKATGFSLAETISGLSGLPIKFTDHASPRIIFYTAASGTISASQCARLVTNRPAVLLNAVVSALEEINWEKLKKQPLVDKQSDEGKPPVKKE